MHKILSNPIQITNTCLPLAIWCIVLTFHASSPLSVLGNSSLQIFPDKFWILTWFENLLIPKFPIE